MPEVALNGITLHYELAGEGPPLLLVPGMLSDGASWQPLVAPLADRFTLILPDLRGAGRTRPLDAEITLELLAADMLALADHLGHARLAVAGHSLGGLVAAVMAAQAPERLTHLVMLASTPLPSARLPAIFATLCALREQGGDGWQRMLFAWLFNDAFFRDRAAVEAAVTAALDYPHAQPLAAMRHQTRALGRINLRALPASLPMPTLALLGAEDALIAPGPAEAAWKARGASTRVLLGLAHSPHWDAPEAVAADIAGFLSAGL
ncbi:alpha/beta fold hydrolase [Thetidibacter halocola]|uniref:Alpha/beta fold hydrolase n=1 Tax=Thetidibacter halocola TaxID=2827239 RepID=A0A8J7WE62_9RHOB|nr:alpha/beta fold hydrolase [Thetidibacter halocola]MBS0125962.1 alpha/beta fold hydrolase [Thetidibacter halocola]